MESGEWRLEAGGWGFGGGLALSGERWPLALVFGGAEGRPALGRGKPTRERKS